MCDNSTNSSILKHCSQDVSMGWWWLPTWVRCSEAWSDVGKGNTVAMFHNAANGLYRVELELTADCVDLVALICELNFAHKWCPFVKLSEQMMDTQYILSGSVVHRLVIHPACQFLIGVMVLYVKQTQYTEKSSLFIKCEDMHDKKADTLRSSYMAFEPFVLEFEHDVTLARTCCSFEVRCLNVFAYVPSFLLFIVCREMLACFVKEWTISAQLLHSRSLDMFALNKQVDRNASHYARISRHLGQM